MLDEYAEDFGTGLENQIPEIKPKVLSNQQVYQNNPEMSIPESAPRPRSAPPHPAPQNYAPPPPNYQPPIYQQYVYQPGYMPAGQVPPAPLNYQQPYQQPLPEGQPRDRISNIFSEESKELNELLRAEERGGCLRNLVFLATCLLIIGGSFWVSYTIGGRLLSGEKKNIIPNIGSKLPRLVSKLKNSIISGTDVVKPMEKFKNYKIPGEPKTPILPPEIINLPPKAYIKPALEIKPKVPAPVICVPKPVYAKPAPVGHVYRVVVGSFDTKAQAEDVIRNIKADGFPAFMYKADGRYRLQIGAFQEKSRATTLMKKAGEYGYNAFISIK